MSRCFALVTVVINFISRNHAFTVKRAMITYGKEYQKLELLFAVKSSHSESVIRRGVKALHFRLWFHETCTRFWNKVTCSIKQTLWPTVRREHIHTRIIRNRDFAAGGAQHHVQVNAPWKKPTNRIDCSYTTLHSKRLIWAYFGFNRSRWNRYWREDT